ncbi:MAG: hypothetical protein LBB09_02015, partial [Rickettsiales bacterium]|nr:hypothetical protein [Rickettsiales bacterium]
MDNFTEKTAEIILFARNLAKKYSNPVITECHVARAMLLDAGALTPKIIELGKGKVSLISELVEKEIEKLPKAYGSDVKDAVLSNSMILILKKSQEAAVKHGEELVTVERLFQTILENSKLVEDIVRIGGATREDIENGIK